MNEKQSKEEPCPKFDADKVRWDLIPLDALEKLAEAYKFGAAKYFEESWRNGLGWKRIYRAMIGHAISSMRGEDIDEDSGLIHLAQVAWNAFTLINFLLNDIGNDDRIKDLKNPELTIFNKDDVKKQIKMLDKKIKERLKTKENFK